MKATAQAPDVIPWCVVTHILCRQVRAEGRLLLTLKVSYPRLCPIPEGNTPKEGVVYTDPQAARVFNACYGKAAEICAETGCRQMGDALAVAFSALPRGERYRFIPGVLHWRMTADIEPRPEGWGRRRALGTRVKVAVSVTSEENRQPLPAAGSVETQTWRFPEGTMTGNTVKKSKKRKKTIEKAR